MKIILASVCAAGFLSSTCPAGLLLKVAWQDRKLAKNHPDYLRVWSGKKLPVIAAALLLFVSALFGWGTAHFLTG